jgi:hypothetical protein
MDADLSDLSENSEIEEKRLSTKPSDAVVPLRRGRVKGPPVPGGAVKIDSVSCTRPPTLPAAGSDGRATCVSHGLESAGRDLGHEGLFMGRPEGAESIFLGIVVRITGIVRRLVIYQP